MTLYEMTPSQVWAAWKNQKLTLGNMLAYQAYAGIYFNPDGTHTPGGRHI